jgi:pyridoxine 5'-phosphate synthase PdxJ
MSVLNRIENLLELSQNASIVLQQKAATVKDSQQLGIILMAGRDLRAGIKDLVKIQDLYDESVGRPEHMPEFEASAEETMERTRKYLHHAMKGTVFEPSFCFTVA